MSSACDLGEVGLGEGKIQPWEPMTLGRVHLQAALVTPVAKLIFSVCSLM